MRKFFLLLLFAILCGQHLVYGQRGFDSLPESSIHIKFGDPIVFTPVEGAESYRFLFSLYGHVDTIQTTTPYIRASEYTGMPLFETYDITMQYYKNSVWYVSEESNRVMIVTDSGTDFLIHDMIKAGGIPNASTSDNCSQGTLDRPIPIVYHVIVPSWFDGEPTEYLSPIKINQSMNILNKVFSGETGELGVDTNIRFEPATNVWVDYCGQRYYGITYNTARGNINLSPSVRHPVQDNTYFPTFDSDQPITDYFEDFPSDKYINIWVFENIVYHNEDVYGITLSPCLGDNIPILAIKKGVVGENDNLPTRSLGYCVAHEMGHYFGLLHAWMEVVMVPYITTIGTLDFERVEIIDSIDDTPDAMGPVYNCDYSNLANIPYDNIMSYTPDGCRYRFTEDQTDRMRENISRFFCNYNASSDIATESPHTDMLDMRIISPVSTVLCGSNGFDIKVRIPDITLFHRLEIAMDDDAMSLTFDDSYLLPSLEENTYIIRIQQSLPVGNYTFTLYSGIDGNDCAYITRKYEVIECDANDVDKHNAQWYFDTYVTLDFRNGIANLGEYSAMDASVSESGICNEYGDILFYTDGDKIWNRSHEIIDAPNLNVVYRGTIALQFDDNHYAVVSLCNDGHLYSRLLDRQGNIIGSSEYSEIQLYGGITAVKCSTGGFWIASTRQALDGLNIISLKMTFDGTSLIYEYGNEINLNSVNFVDRKAIVIKASPNGKYIVCATANSGENGGLKTLYFNATHGAFDERVGSNVIFDAKAPSLAFSPSGNFLYLAYNESGLIKIMQYDMRNDFSCNCDNGFHGNIVFCRPDTGDYTRCELALQEGPDGRIYFSRYGDYFGYSRRIGVIQEPDNLASSNNGELDCNVRENLIDYTPGTLLQNKENLPNMVDAKNVNICNPGFSICSEDCNIETLNLRNFSLSPTLTWSFYDLSGNLITTSTDIEPVLSSITELYNRDAFIIKQTTACGDGYYMIDTVSFNAQLQIVGEDRICLDGRPYTYSVSLEPHSQIRQTEWVWGNNISSNDAYSDLTIIPPYTSNSFTITCNAQGQFCEHTASLTVNADPDCSFVANIIPNCNSGEISLINNSGADQSNYQAEIIIDGNNYDFSLTNGSLLFRYRDIYYRSGDSNDYDIYSLLENIHLENLNATIIVTNNETHNETEIEVTIPRTNPTYRIEGIVTPALCSNEPCVVSLVVSGGEFDSDYNEFSLIEEMPNGDRIYHIAVYTDNDLLNGEIVVNGYRCNDIKDLLLPYVMIKPRLNTSHTDICNNGGTASITIEMDYLYMEDGYIPYVTWNDTNERTYFVLQHGARYIAIRNNVVAGTYTPTVHYVRNCSVSLNQISIEDSPQEILAPNLHIQSTYLCNETETASVTIEMDINNIEEGFVPYIIWDGGRFSYFEQLPETADTYTTTISVTGSRVHFATVFYTSTCSADITFTIEVIPPPNPIVSHTDICSEDETASITIEMELQYIENGFTPTATWNNGETTNFSLQEGTTYITTLNNAEAGLYTAEVQYTSYCSMPLENSISIAVSDIDVSYTNISENEVGIHLNFDPPLSSYTISITENGITTETTTSQNPYYFVTNINNDVEITTSCGTIPLNFRVSDVAVNLKSEACQESDADISFEISGGTAPYTATFTCGDYTTTQIFNNSGPCVMHAEIIQGTANHLTIVSASGDTYNINLGTINNISSIAVLSTGNLGTSYDGGTYIVTSGLTFNHDVTFNGSTIYCTYEDSNDITSTQWTVNVGKTVTFENCTIKAACPDKMWQGIVVNGNEFAAQSATTHATVDIKQNSVIADAMFALKSVYGGIIKANNSVFRNNQYDLYFDKYKNYKHTKTVIRGNKFLTLDGGLNNPNYYPHAHIYMNQVDGISIRSNTFRNENMDADISKWGIGVESSLSGFTLSPRYLTITDPVPVEPRDTFDNLYYGVKASGKGTTAPAIKHNVFTNNFRGVYINNADGSRVLFNNFTGIYDRIYPWQVVFTRAINRPIAIHYLDRYSEPYSVYISNSPVSYCEENTITRCEIGAYMSNSGREDISRMYRNKFGRQPEAGRSTDIEGATMILGTNSSSNGQEGLVVSCNEYTGTGSAIDVKGNMRQNQGSENEPAGNKFHSTFVNGMEFNAPNTRVNYNYYYNITANNGFHTVLERYTGVNTPIPINSINTCKSNYSKPIIFDDHLERIDFQGKEVARLKSTYDSIVDRGNTDAMLVQASSVSLFNMVIPFVALCNDGYLSDTVYSTLIANTNSPFAFTTAVLIANSPLPQSVRKMVENSDLPSIYKTLVGFCQTGTNSRDQLQYNIDDGKQEIIELESEMFHEALNNDTIVAVKDTVLTYLRGKSDHNYNDAINEYKLLLSKKDYAAVRDALKGIYGMTSGMDSYLRDELTNFCSVNNIYVDYLTATSEAEAAKILDGNSATLLSAVNDSSPLYSGLAEILYEKYADGIFLEYTPLPEMIITNKSMIVSKEPDTTLFVPYVTIYPNPTDGMVFVEYNFEYTKENGIEFLLDVLGKPHVEDCDNGTLNLFSPDSKILFNMQLVQSAGIAVIDLSSYPAGTYFVEVLDCIGNASSLKIIKY